MTNEKSATTWVPHALFLSLVLVAAVVCRWSLIAVGGSSLTVDAYALFAFIPPVTLALVWAERRRIFLQTAYWRPVAVAYVFLIAASFWSSILQGLSVSILLFSGSCIAAFGLCYGRAALARAGFPLTLLLAMAPLPEQWLNRCIVLLQEGSASATGWLFMLARIPFTREGLIFALPRLDIEIAKECSGIRSSMVLLVCGLVLAHRFLRSGWTKAALALAVVPLTIAKNGLRIFTLSMLGMYVDPSFLTGRLHHEGGILFFASAFAALLGLTKLFERTDRPRPLVGNERPVAAVVAKHHG